YGGNAYKRHCVELHRSSNETQTRCRHHLSSQQPCTNRQMNADRDTHSVKKLTANIGYPPQMSECQLR
ncbi:hypothetical protein BIW11_07697, partial [Tropilaelaps mercedesae]